MCRVSKYYGKNKSLIDQNDEAQTKNSDKEFGNSIKKSKGEGKQNQQ